MDSADAGGEDMLEILKEVSVNQPVRFLLQRCVCVRKTETDAIASLLSF